MCLWPHSQLAARAPTRSPELPGQVPSPFSADFVMPEECPAVGLGWGRGGHNLQALQGVRCGGLTPTHVPHPSCRYPSTLGLVGGHLGLWAAQGSCLLPAPVTQD
jgi:hypothetical protein